MNSYETVFILSPDLTEDQAKTTNKKYKKILADSGAKIIHEENWGLKKIPYPIKEKTKGYYFLYEYRSDVNTPAELETALKKDSLVLRFMTIKLDKHGNKPEGAEVI